MEKIQQNCDFLVLGTGISGLSLALELAKVGHVTLLSKDTCRENNSWYAQGGIASVLNEADSFSAHIGDTLEAGAGLCHKNIVEETVQAGPRMIQKLIELGVPFTKEKGPMNKQTAAQPYHLTVEGGHSKRRVIHVQDATGQSVIRTLIAHASAHPNIKILEDKMAVDLITTDGVAPSFESNSCLGAYIYDKQTEEVFTIAAKKTYLCTGGHGKIYLYTSNPDVATGDGLAMAWRAGCRVANLEFMQFHPTCLYSPQFKNVLVSEAVRGEGAKLCGQDGHYFMQDYHEDLDLAPRDIVARAIDSELKKSGQSFVNLDISPIGLQNFERMFPSIYSMCIQANIDLSAMKIPVVPAAHYSCGGVVVDAHGRTDIENLFAIGEVACTGLHGANRLASNSLLEGLVFAHRAAKVSSVDDIDRACGAPIQNWNPGKAKSPEDDRVILQHHWDEIRRLMWHFVGIVRSDKRLLKAAARIEQIIQELQEYYWRYYLDDKIIEVRNLALVAKLTIQCAMVRKESRGIHYNVDYDYLDDRIKDTVINK